MYRQKVVQIQKLGKKMRYLIITNCNQPFLTNWFDSNNYFNENIEMVVYDLSYKCFTINGKDWDDIEIDHL